MPCFVDILRGLLFSEQKLWRKDLGKTGGKRENARREGREDCRRGVWYERKKRKIKLSSTEKRFKTFK